MSIKFKDFLKLENLDENLDEVLNMQQRRQKARKMRVMGKKMAIGRKRAMKRAATPAKLKQRAEKAARATVFKKLSKGKSKDQVPLMKRIEKDLNGKTNILKVYSSLYAIPFYQKIGYKKSTGIRWKKGMVCQPMKKVI